MTERNSWVTIMLAAWAAVDLCAVHVTRCHAANLLALPPAQKVTCAAAAQRDPENERRSARSTFGDAGPGRLIVIGFVGGFVKQDDAHHPEVQLAAELLRRYSSSAYVKVFGNHDRAAAYCQVLHWLDTDGDGILTAAEKKRARIIIYGHSWGASETVTLARALGRMDIPVLLTIQVDSIRKSGEDDGLIPPNVASAVNFYQPDGLFHGRPEIAAADPARTKILGNFRMAYVDEPIPSGSSSWLARLFMKSHIQIENDPHIWQKAASLIDSQFSQDGLAGHAEASNTAAAGR